MITMGNLAPYEAKIKELEAHIARLEAAIATDQGNTFLITVLADIRGVTGVDEKPMLTELAGAIGDKFSTLQQQLTGLAKSLGDAQTLIEFQSIRACAKALFLDNKKEG